MSNHKISCLTSTYGRLSKLNEAVSCFLDQDYENKELIILNNHPVNLSCDLKNVKVYNEPIYSTLGDCRNRLIELADSDFVRTWDDDDLYFPWSLSQGINNIRSFVAWKPSRSWFWCKDKSPELAGNAFEASIIVRTDVAKKYKYSSNTMGDEHLSLLEGIEKEGGCKHDEVGVLSSYCYRWGWGMWHTSGSLGSGTVESRTKEWIRNNQDIQDGIIRYIDLSKYWNYFPESFKQYYGKK